MTLVSNELESVLSPATLEFLRQEKQLLIDGEWAPAADGATLAVIDPATGAEVDRIAAAGAADVDRAAVAARAAFRRGEWRRMPPPAQTRLMLQLADLIDADAELLVELETLDSGKPLLASQFEVGGAAELLRYYAGWTTKITGTVNPVGPDVLSYTSRDPIGVCAGIIPWNCPLVNAIYKIAPAIACGNVVIVKPAEQTSLTALRLGELIRQAGFPAGVIQILTGLGEVAGQELVTHREVDKIAFTGSTETGRLIAELAAPSLKKVTLELGGKSPAIFFADADLDNAIAHMFSPFGIWYNTGQICVANTRMLVQREVYDDVVAAAVAASTGYQVGSPFDAATQMGPLVSEDQLDRVLGYLALGEEQGVDLRLGGKQRGDCGYFVEPTVIADLDPSTRLAQEEIFGPVVGFIPFDTEEEALRIANDTEFGLAASVWTSDVQRAHRFAGGLESGVVWINSYSDTSHSVPFGGVKQSGYGRECGEESIHSYTQTKSVYCRIEPVPTGESPNSRAE